MKINKVEICNFYSIKNVELSLDKYKGIVLIEGQNKDTGGSNGSGKSALIEAVVWGLFGRTVRKSTEEALVNNQTKKGCKVRITINDDYVIERGKKPVYLKFFHKDKELTKDNATNTQAYIEELLHTNYKVFLASTVFGQQNNIEFINATPEDKRVIIKNFLNLDELFSLRDTVKRLKSQFSAGIKKSDTLISEHSKTISKFDKELETLAKLKKEIESTDIAKALETPLAEIVEIERKNTEDKYTISRLEREITILDNKQKEIKNRLDNPNENISCPTCGQAVSNSVHPKHSMVEYSDLQSEIEEKQEEIFNLQSEFREPPISSLDYHKVHEYRTLAKEAETYESLKKDTLEALQEVHDKKADYSSQYDIMRFWEKAFSESGIVKYVIRNVLEYFNSKVNFYLSHLSQGKFFINFDEELKETITHNDYTVPYISLSGGEKKKISLSVMLGLQELLKMSHDQKTNLMFFDEVAENLDQEGLEGLYILLSELKKDKSLFVITHNNYLKSLMDNSKAFTMIKENGESKLKVK
jgi:exonuclease SbcC